MSVDRLKRALKLARASRPRRIIAERSDAIEGGDPSFDQWMIEKHEERIRRPPEGLRLRTHCAAVGYPLLSALADLDYWPPLGLGARQVGIALVRDFCGRVRLRIAAEDIVSGRVVIEL